MKSADKKSYIPLKYVASGFHKVDSGFRSLDYRFQNVKYLMTPASGFLYIAYIGLVGRENKSTRSQLTLLCVKLLQFLAVNSVMNHLHLKQFFGTGARAKTAYSEDQCKHAYAGKTLKT